MNNDKMKEDYDNDIHSKQLDKKCFLPWSPLEESKILSKHRYVSCSRSAPQKSKRFVRYKLSRSLYLDVNIRNSSSGNSSFVEDKHLSRSAKIMRALNVSSSRAYYERTKIKKSLNFNLTPSPKRFVPARKGIRKALSLSFSPPVFGSSKTLDYDDNPNDTTNSSSIFTSSESIDENQNETPSQQSMKGHGTLHYSTPNTRLSRKSLCSTSFAPVLPDRLNETIDNVMCSSTTPNSHSSKYIEGRSKCLDNIATNTSRNLFREFHGSDDDDDDDGDDNRPHTPENFIRIIPESMSAIKRSHKKERSSRRSEHYPQFANDFGNNVSISKNETDTVEDYDYIPIDLYSDKSLNLKDISVCDFEDGISDTGSLFDYTEERKHISEDSEKASDSVLSCDSGPSKFHGYDIKGKPKLENLCERETADHNEIIGESNDVKTSSMFARYDNAMTEVRSVTPDPTTEIALQSQESITPENDINVLRSLAKDSIKKSRSKSKGDNRRKLFSPKVFQCKVEVTEEEDTKCWQDVKQEVNPEDDRMVSQQNNHLERACTPENINSSRLLLSQYSSIKKSHRKDKHNKIVSGFLKRQEYFNKEIDFVRDADNEIKGQSDDGRPEYNKSVESLSSEFDAVTNADDSTSSVTHVDEIGSFNRLSPSKRKIPLDVSLDRDTHNVSCDSELQESDASAAEEFKIFTPLKRKRPLIPSAVKENYYDLPLGKDEISDEVVANIGLSRCLTPVLNFHDNYTTRITDENFLAAVKLESSIASEEVPTEEIHDGGDSDGTTGRLTPRNMSTVELYSNLDSIKKSHKKNKRENCSRKSFKLVRNNCYDEESQAVSKDIENDTYDKLESSDDCIGLYDTNKSIDHNDIDIDIDLDLERSGGSRGSDENLASTSTEKLLQNVTPPNSLKTRNYIKLLRETSIKRSHKKVRDQKKHELLTAEANDLSDDGSIFGDEEKLVLTEDQFSKK